MSDPRHRVNKKPSIPPGRFHSKGKSVPRIGYTIIQAADAAGVTVRVVEVAVRDKRLRALRIDGQAVMLKGDIIEWLGTHPEWT